MMKLECNVSKGTNLSETVFCDVAKTTSLTILQDAMVKQNPHVTTIF